jgi:hypothetical protein
MIAEAGAVYQGDVVHKRLRPVPHHLSYKVFSLLLDVDRIDEVARTVRIFSRNRPNLVAFYDKDHGRADGACVAQHARHTFVSAGFDVESWKILLLAYPRVLGYAFNPISVYYGFGPSGALEGLIYEVSNTFGERTSYVVAAGRPEGTVFHHGAVKKMYVSPFAEGSGRYGFRVVAPGANLLLGVQYRDREGPLIKTLFRAHRRPLNDGTLLRLLVSLPLMTVKVMAAIHLEALKLWLKGIPLTPRHQTGAYTVSPGETELLP